MFFLQISLFSRSDAATWEMCLLNLPQLSVGYWGAFWGKIKQPVTRVLLFLYDKRYLDIQEYNFPRHKDHFMLSLTFSTGQIKLAAESKSDTGKKIFTPWTVLENLGLNEYWVKDGWHFYIILLHSNEVWEKGFTLSYFWSWRSGIFHLYLVDTEKTER